MEDLDERHSFLAEPDADAEEDAGDVLARQLSALSMKQDTEASTTYGTFQGRVGIGAALAQLPALEALPDSSSPHFGGFDHESALDRIVEIEKRVEKERQKRAIGSDFSHTDKTYDLSEDAKQEALAKAASDDYYGAPSEKNFDGVLDIFTKKGRKKLKEKKDRVNKAVHEEKARIIDERLARRKEKEKEKEKTMAAMAPSERIEYENSKLDMPPLHDPVSFEKSKSESLRIKATDEQMRRRREKARNLERYMKGLMPPERVLVEHVNEVVRHGPSVDLQSVESTFKAAAARAPELNYFGALALGAALGKIRATVEAEAPSSLKGEALKRATEGFHAQATTPMDKAKATLFADALDNYSVYVRKAATSASSDARGQAEVAIQLGENLADALAASTPAASSSWNANHPSVALTAVTDRLFQSTMRAAVADSAFVDKQLKSFWAAEMTRGQWKAVTQKHFI